MSANFGTNEKILEVGLSGPEAQPKLRMQNAPEVNVHASAASDAGPSNPVSTSGHVALEDCQPTTFEHSRFVPSNPPESVLDDLCLQWLLVRGHQSITARPRL
jgi:hypothetical protein